MPYASPAWADGPRRPVGPPVTPAQRLAPYQVDLLAEDGSTLPCFQKAGRVYVLGDHGDRFYPGLSGVARSYNFYPMPPARPEDGVVNLALGLGKTIVDGGVAWNYSPAYPTRTPPFAGARAMVRETQSEFWAVNMGKPPAYDPVNEVEYLVKADLAAAEADESLRYLASTYDAEADRLVLEIGDPGPRVLTFAPLLVLEEFPFNDLVRAVLAAAEQATRAKVEIEFAMTGVSNEFL